jgi:hypothetical protein
LWAIAPNKTGYIHLRVLKKLALIMTKAMGLSSVGGNPKNNEEIPASSREVSKEDEWISFWSCCSRAKKRIPRILFVWEKRVAHTNKNFWSVYLARHTNYSKLVYLRVTHLTFSFPELNI